MAAPAWLAATAGQQAVAGQVNQFLASHATAYVYQGAEQASAAAGSGSVSSDGLWIAQAFTTGSSQTAAGRILVTAAVTGSPVPWALSVQATSGSAPSGTALASVQVPAEFMSGTAASVQVILPVSGLAASTGYWLVAEAAGDASDYFSWSKSAAASGASTSPDGTTWTAQPYGLAYAVYDQSAILPLAGTWEDSGARWMSLASTGGQVTGISEFTAGQTAAGYTASVRALSYSSGVLAGVA